MEALASAWELGLAARFREAARDAKLLAVDRETVALQLPQGLQAIQVSCCAVGGAGQGTQLTKPLRPGLSGCAGLLMH